MSADDEPFRRRIRELEADVNRCKLVLAEATAFTSIDAMNTARAILGLHPVGLAARSPSRTERGGRMTEKLEGSKVARVYDDRDDDRLLRIDAALALVPLARYDDTAKLAEYAIGEFITERDRYEAALREIAAMEVPVDAEDIKYMQAHLYHRMRDLAHRALSSEDAKERGEVKDD